VNFHTCVLCGQPNRAQSYSLMICSHILAEE
jgi:hypothetical protein